MEKKKRSGYLDCLRILAILMVLYNHQGTYTYFMEIGKLNIVYFISISFSILCKCGPPLFFMVSGALLLGKEEKYLYILRHRVLRIFIVMLIAAAWMSRSDFSIRNYLLNLFANSNWYLYAYLAYLFMLPFIRAMVAKLDKGMIWLLLLLSFSFSTITAVFHFLKISNSISIYLILFTSDWASKCWHIVFPIAGYYLANTERWNLSEEEEKIQRKVLMFLTIASLTICIVLITLNMRMDVGCDLELLRQYFIIIPSCFLFYSCKRFFENYECNMSNILIKGISTVSKTTFGVFLIEVFTPMNVWIYNNIAVKTVNYVGVYVSFIVAILIEFVFCTIVVCFCKKIPLVNKLL